MKEFVVYTALRLLMLLGTAAVVYAVWDLAAGPVTVGDLMWVLVIAFVISGAASLVLLNRQREAFATRVDARARKASARFEELRAREDVD